MPFTPLNSSVVPLAFHPSSSWLKRRSKWYLQQLWIKTRLLLVDALFNVQFYRQHSRWKKSASRILNRILSRSFLMKLSLKMGELRLIREINSTEYSEWKILKLFDLWFTVKWKFSLAFIRLHSVKWWLSIYAILSPSNLCMIPMFHSLHDILVSRIARNEFFFPL